MVCQWSLLESILQGEGHVYKALEGMVLVELNGHQVNVGNHESELGHLDCGRQSLMCWGKGEGSLSSF